MDNESRARHKGLLLALVTALISGVAVFFNGYGVRAWSDVADATTYTTVKNLMAAVIVGIVGVTLTRIGSRQRPSLPPSSGQRWMLAAIALIGGSVPFALFFEGLSRASSAEAAFIHKILVVWVAMIAFVFLRERIGWPHLVAIGLLVWGQLALSGGVGSLRLGPGEIMVLVATILWSLEIVVAKRLLPTVSYATIADARMIGGAVVLVAWGLARGAEIDWSAITGAHVVWVAVAAFFLSGYVLTWLKALALAPAVDVTAVLVAGALVTAVLQTTVQGAPLPNPTAAAVILIGTVLAGVISWNRLDAGRP